MPIVLAQSSLVPEESAVSLARYARLIGVEECGFWGVYNSTLTYPECRGIWSKSDRDMIARYLAEAQIEIEAVLRYPLSRRWFTDEQHPYSCPVLTDWREVVSGGVKAITVISAGEAVDHTADPAVIGPIATTVTDPNEVHVYYPVSLVEEEIEIMPSDIDILAGLMVISIPRCRMVIPTLADNSPTGIDYSVVANFLTTVDVKRIYNDTSTNADLIWPHRCSTCGTCASCGEYTQDGCIYVRDSRIGILDVLPATYSGGAWSVRSAACCNGTPERMRLNYYAGKLTLNRQEEDTIIRLAHAKMPQEPCACDPVRWIWKRDRFTPEILTRERLNCNFGTQDGAWFSWRQCQQMRLVRGGLL